MVRWCRRLVRDERQQAAERRKLHGQGREECESETPAAGGLNQPSIGADRISHASGPSAAQGAADRAYQFPAASGCAAMPMSVTPALRAASITVMKC